MADDNDVTATPAPGASGTNTAGTVAPDIIERAKQLQAQKDAATRKAQGKADQWSIDEMDLTAMRKKDVAAGRMSQGTANLLNKQDEVKKMGLPMRWLQEAVDWSASSNQAVIDAMVNGVTETIAGVAQHFAPHKSEEIAKYVEGMRSSRDEIEKKAYGRSEEEAAAEHPTLSGTGHLIGEVAPWVAGGEALAPLKLGARLGLVKEIPEEAPAVAKLLMKIPRVAKNMLVGAVMGGSDFQPEGEERSRVPGEIIGSVLNTIIGPVGGAIARKVAEKAAQGGEIDRLLHLYSRRLDDLAPHLSDIKSKIEDTFAKGKKVVQDAFERRAGVSAGEQVDQQAVLKGYKTLGDDIKHAPVDSRIGPTMSAVRKELNVDQLTAVDKHNWSEMKRYMTEKGAYNSVMTEHLNTFNKDLVASGGGGISLEQFSQMTEGGRKLGISPPELPKLIQAPPLDYNAVFRAYTGVNKALRWTDDPAVGNQLGQVKTFLRGLVDDNPRVANAMEVANREHIDRVVPFQKQFGYGAFEEGITGAKTAVEVDTIARQALESRDPEKLAAFMKMVGPNAKESLQKVAMRNVLERGIPDVLTLQEKIGGKEADYGRYVNVGSMRKYLSKNRENLTRVLTPDQWKEMNGFINLMEQLPKAKGEVGHHMLPSFIGFIALEHAARGEFISAAKFAGSGMAASMVFRLFGKLADMPSARGLMKQAATLKPGSPELEKLKERVSQTIADFGTAATVTGGQAANQYLQ